MRAWTSAWRWRTAGAHRCALGRARGGRGRPEITIARVDERGPHGGRPTAEDERGRAEAEDDRRRPRAARGNPIAREEGDGARLWATRTWASSAFGPRSPVGHACLWAGLVAGGCFFPFLILRYIVYKCIYMYKYIYKCISVYNVKKYTI